jgi:hypothetical protein
MQTTDFGFCVNTVCHALSSETTGYEPHDRNRGAGIVKNCQTVMFYH